MRDAAPVVGAVHVRSAEVDEATAESPDGADVRVVAEVVVDQGVVAEGDTPAMRNV